MTTRETLETLCRGQSLSREAALELFSRVLRGEVSEVELAALLIGFKAKGETPEEIAGAAQALRDAALALDVGSLKVSDSCGTGGDGAATVNISTAVALVVAEAGVPVAKHGNRSISSRCGSADVLEASGVKIDAPPEVSRRCLDELGICFLFAPQYHAGVRHAMPVRRALGVRTLFNLLGPLSNPARPAWQVVGVYDATLCAPLARTLGLLGCERALVVNGCGLDEIALHGPTVAALWREGSLEELVLRPEQAGLQRRPLEALRGGGAEENARWLRDLLGGRGEAAHAEIVAINAGALLWVSGRAADLREGTAQALEVLRAGGAEGRLARWAERSHGA
ncbi:MAG: anthranilate phosphoribosyltransferase [Deltaproteobacteria bacterium]|nr:anthranilate phosphoribosyltransferase [Deltaproteobacteria bacterium]